jgi:hypothetical protein
VWSGVQGSRILYVRIISLCGGTQFALFEIVYSNQAAAELRPVVSRLGQSLTATGRGQC